MHECSSGVTRIWYEGHEMRRQLRAAKTKSTGGFSLWEANPVMTPNFSLNFSRKNHSQQHKHFTQIFSFSEFNLSFPRTNQAYRSCYSFVFKPVYLLSRYHAMQFAMFLFKWLQNLTPRFTKTLQLQGTQSQIHCQGFVPGPHWGLPYPKPHDFAR